MSDVSVVVHKLDIHDRLVERMAQITVAIAAHDAEYAKREAAWCAAHATGLFGRRRSDSELQMMWLEATRWEMPNFKRIRLIDERTALGMLRMACEITNDTTITVSGKYIPIVLELRNANT